MFLLLIVAGAWFMITCSVSGLVRKQWHYSRGGLFHGLQKVVREGSLGFIYYSFLFLGHSAICLLPLHNQIDVSTSGQGTQVFYGSPSMHQ